MPVLLLSSRLKELMESEKISKRKLSLEAKVERKSITTYLKGVCIPRYDALARISDFFEVSSDFLLGFEKENYYCYKTTCPIDEIPSLFADRLKKLMIENKLSQGKLAKKLTMQQTCVSKWLRMITMPETPVLTELSKIFDCKIDYFIGRERIN